MNAFGKMPCVGCEDERQNLGIISATMRSCTIKPSSQNDPFWTGVNSIWSKEPLLVYQIS